MTYSTFLKEDDLKNLNLIKTWLLLDGVVGANLHCSNEPAGPVELFQSWLGIENRNPPQLVFTPSPSITQFSPITFALTLFNMES